MILEEQKRAGKKKQNTMKKLFIYLITLLLMVNCGARKAEKLRVKESIKTETTATDQTKETTAQTAKKEIVKTTDNRDETVTETVTYTPIDPNKPATATDEKGETHLLQNVAYIIKRTYTKNKTTVKEAAAEETTQKAEILSDIKEVKAINEQLNANGSNLDRKPWNSWNLLWILVPVGLIALFFKYKGKIWWL
jgi:hypothetical protein